MKQNKYTRSFLGKAGSYLTAFRAVGGDYPWCELMRCRDSICFDDAYEAERAAKFLLRWAEAVRTKPKPRRGTKGRK